RGVDDGARCRAACGEQRRRAQRLRKQLTCHRDEGAIRLACPQYAYVRRHLFDETFGDQAAAGASAWELTGVLSVVEKGKIGWPGAVELRDAADRSIERRRGKRLRAGQRRYL